MHIISDHDIIRRFKDEQDSKLLTFQKEKIALKWIDLLNKHFSYNTSNVTFNKLLFSSLHKWQTDYRF